MEISPLGAENDFLKTHTEFFLKLTSWIIFEKIKRGRDLIE